MIPLLAAKKRLKVAVGGRGGSKSIAVGDYCTARVAQGKKVLCAREFQNSIEDSVHGQLEARIDHNGWPGFDVQASRIVHESGGMAIYKGLSRNIEAIKSIYGVDTAWVEEAQTLSQKTLDLLLPSIRESDSEVIFTLNRGSSKDPVSRMLLKPHEKDLQRSGIYEDDEIIIVQINWDDNPFFPAELDEQRRRDKRILSDAKYRHIWEGDYSDTVEDAIIEPDWFDACIDAHERLGFKPQGLRVVTHDPADTGKDDAALADRHGAVFVNVATKSTGEVDESVDWATDYAIERRADVFSWDAGGLGAGIKRQVGDNLAGKKIDIQMFNGASGVDRPGAEYEPIDGEVLQAKTNSETFLNKRAQYYWMLRDRVFKTYLAVSKNHAAMYHQDELISFSSSIADIDTLRAEICRIPRKPNGAGKIQIMSKDDMRKLEIESPNMADCCMMSLAAQSPVAVVKPIKFKAW